jgi:hypothetical protein
VVLLLRCGFAGSGAVSRVVIRLRVGVSYTDARPYSERDSSLIESQHTEFRACSSYSSRLSERRFKLL